MSTADLERLIQTAEKEIRPQERASREAIQHVRHLHVSPCYSSVLC